VTSIPALLTTLANNTVTEIVVANGTYLVDGAANKTANSLWIGSAFASRTNPVTVRAETTGGVTFTSGGYYFGAITFVEGAHHQTWQGFVFANGKPRESGVIVFGGYPDKTGTHHITLKDITIKNVGDPADPRGHAIYFSQAIGGSHDITIDGLTISDPLGGIKGGLHFYHSENGAVNASNVTIRHVAITGTRQFAIVVWDETTSNIVIEDTTITNAFAWAVRFELPGQLTLRRVTSTGSALGGFYSSLGANPPGVILVDSSFN
jgi:hypothetical protein